MAKKPPASKDKSTSIRLELSDQTHQRFRVEAAKDGKSMAAMARQLVEDWLKTRRP